MLLSAVASPYDLDEDFHLDIPVTYELEAEARAFATGYFIGHNVGRAQISTQF